MSTLRLLSVTIIATALLVAGCSTLHLDSSSLSVPVWTTEGETPRRTNAVETALEPPLELVWDFNAGAGFGNASPLIVGDVVLVATRKGEVHAVDIESGKRLGQTSFGESIDGTPVIEDGILFVPISWGGQAVRAYDLRHGSSRWKVKGAPVSAGLVVHEETVVAADVEGFVRAYNREDGGQRWEIQLGDRVGVKAAPLLVNARLIVGDDAGRVTALDADNGEILWQVDLGAPVHVSPAASDETVFVSTTRGALTALNIDGGEVQWQFELTSDEVYLASPAVGSREIVFGASDGYVRSLSITNGAVLWSTEVGGAVTAPPLITDQTVYVGTMRSMLIGLSREDGTQTWETELDGRIKSPFATKGSQIVVLAEPRLVYLFGLSEESYATTEN